MSTYKNTFKYLCLVFGFTITHLIIRVLIWNFVPENSMFTPLFYILLADIPLTALILYFFLYYSGKFTGEAAQKRPAGRKNDGADFGMPGKVCPKQAAGYRAFGRAMGISPLGWAFVGTGCSFRGGKAGAAASADFAAGGEKAHFYPYTVGYAGNIHCG